MFIRIHFAQKIQTSNEHKCQSKFQSLYMYILQFQFLHNSYLLWKKNISSFPSKTRPDFSQPLGFCLTEQNNLVFKLQENLNDLNWSIWKIVQSCVLPSQMRLFLKSIFHLEIELRKKRRHSWFFCRRGFLSPSIETKIFNKWPEVVKDGQS